MREITEDLKVGDKVVTRDGRDGRVICTDMEADESIVFLVKDEYNMDEIFTCYKNGRVWKNGDTWLIEDDCDIFLPPKTIMLDLYEINRNGNIHYKAIPSGDSAVGTGTITYIKTIETEIE